MGGMVSSVSKLFRPLVIDLTKDDDDDHAPLQSQRPLPDFAGLIRNNAFTPQPLLRTVLPSPSPWPNVPAFSNFFQTPPPRLPDRGPDIAVKEPDDGTEVTIGR